MSQRAIVVVYQTYSVWVDEEEAITGGRPLKQQALETIDAEGGVMIRSDGFVVHVCKE